MRFIVFLQNFLFLPKLLKKKDVALLTSGPHVSEARSDPRAASEEELFCSDTLAHSAAPPSLPLPPSPDEFASRPELELAPASQQWRCEMSAAVLGGAAAAAAAPFLDRSFPPRRDVDGVPGRHPGIARRRPPPLLLASASAAAARRRPVRHASPRSLAPSPPAAPAGLQPQRRRVAGTTRGECEFSSHRLSSLTKV